MAKILSVVIGNSVTRICVMDFRVKNPKVYKYFCIPTPQGVLEDGFVKENAEFSLAMRRALSENKIKTKQVVFSVTSSKIVTREVLIPSVKINQVGAFVKANANDYFPIDLSMYEIAHVVLGMAQGEDGKEKLRVMVMAAGKDLIAGYAKFASSCGLRLSTIDYSGNSVYQIMKSECDETTLVIKVEDSSTVASVISEHSLMLQRNLAYGIGRALETLMESPEFYEASYMEAFNMMCKKPCVKVVLSERTRVRERDEVFNESESAAAAREEITATFAQLISNLARLIELYHSKSPEYPVKQILLVGLGSEIAGLSKLFTNELGIPTKVLVNLKGASTYHSLDSVGMGRYVGSIGAAIEPVSLMSEQMKKKNAKGVNYSHLSVLTGILFAVLIGGMVTMSLVPYMMAKREEKRLKQQELTYSEAEVVHNQYMSMTAFYTDLKNKCKMPEHSNDGLVAFLTELEQKLPSDVTLTEITSDAESAVLNMKASSLEEAAKIFQILRGFDSVMDVNVGTTAEDDSEEGDKRMTFSAICYYYPIEIEEPEANAASQAAE